jgi:hypothetical protein
MGWLTDLLTFPVTGPVKGLMWVAEKITEQTEKELYSEDTVRRKLLELEMRFDLGEISEEDYTAAEETLLALLSVIRARQKAEQEAEEE